MLCVVVTNMLGVDMGMFGAEAAQLRKGSRAANGGAGEWGSRSHAPLTHEPLVRGKRGWETSGMGHECSKSISLGPPAMEVVKERV